MFTTRISGVLRHTTNSCKRLPRPQSQRRFNSSSPPSNRFLWRVALPVTIGVVASACAIINAPRSPLSGPDPLEQTDLPLVPIERMPRFLDGAVLRSYSATTEEEEMAVQGDVAVFWFHMAELYQTSLSAQLVLIVYLAASALMINAMENRAGFFSNFSKKENEESLVEMTAMRLAVLGDLGTDDRTMKGISQASDEAKVVIVAFKVMEVFRHLLVARTFSDS